MQMLEYKYSYFIDIVAKFVFLLTTTTFLVQVYFRLKKPNSKQEAEIKLRYNH